MKMLHFHQRSADSLLTYTEKFQKLSRPNLRRPFSNRFGHNLIIGVRDRPLTANKTCNWLLLT